MVFAPVGGPPTLGEAVDNTTLPWTTVGNAPWLGQTTVSYAGGDAARSGAIAHAQVSTLRTTVAGPGVLSFWWRTSSEAGFDLLKLAVDGVVQAGAISGETAWAQRSVTLGAGNHTVEWSYAKDATVAVGQDAGWVDAVSFTPSAPSLGLTVAKAGTGTGTVISQPAGIQCGPTCTANFTQGSAVTLTASPNAGSNFTGWSGACSGSAGCALSMDAAKSVTATFTLVPVVVDLMTALDVNFGPWLQYGGAPWFGQTATFYFGGSAAQSGAITHNQQTTVAATVTGPGTLRYWWRTSSEANFDFLRFTYDGAVQTGGISGEQPWQQQVWTIPAGTHSVSWVYSKDGTVSSGSDAAWLDKVEFVPGAVAPATQNAVVRLR